MARGKKKPAAVSGPGALSRRTDLTPAAQPVRVAPGGVYGERKALTNLQQASPLAAGGSPARRPGPPLSGQPPSASGAQGAFGPTQRPAESPLTGAFNSARALPEDPDMLLRILYSLYPHPDIARLIDINAG